MPRGDRTGPLGEGPRTGRGIGYCSGSDSPGYAGGLGRAFGRRMRGGMGRGFGRGMGRRFARGGGFGWGYDGYALAPLTAKEEAEDLKREASLIKSEMEMINKRIKELESDKDSNK